MKKRFGVAAVIMIGSVAQSLNAQLSVVPVAHEVIPIKGSTILNTSSGDVERTIAKIATTMGARLGKSPRGNVVVALRRPAIKLDENCIYPIINSKTGGRIRTFASFQLELTQGIQSRDTRASGDVLLELSLQPIDGGRTRLEFSSNCMADTELGRVLANSTLKFERAFLSQLAPGLNLETWVTAASATVDVPAEAEYRARSEFDANDIHRDVLRSLHPGVSERTLVRAVTTANLDDVWRAAQRVTSQFADLRGLAVTLTDERFHQIQNGDASVGGGDRAWREDLTTTISDTGGGRTRITVVRRLLVPSSDSLTWHGYPSDGEMESWLIGAIMRELPTFTPKPKG
jgi:hypothetical protein